ncbi:MAG: TolC family protein [Burkholderiaceae bacterium]
MAHQSTHPGQRLRLSLLSVLTAAVAAGCAVSPEPVTDEAVKNRVVEDRARMYADQEPITGALSYEDVVSRVMKYNLDFRLRMMEATLAQRRLDVGNWDMFPRLMANAGWVTRNNDSGGRSVSIETGQETLSASSSQERTRRLGGLEFSWNLLDFGVSYYRAKALADQALIAEERKRKVVQNLMQDTRIAFWRALGAQRLTDKMGALMERSNVALARARQIEQQGLLPQSQALAYQRALLDSTTLLQVRRQDLEIARAELSALMNLRPGTRFTLADATEAELPPLPADLEGLETVALEQRPELREEDYRRRISVNDTRRAIASVLPSISFNAGPQYDSNRFLYNNSWFEAGLQFSGDLFRLASLPAVKRAGKAQLDVDDTRRLAQSMAILTQVRVAALRYNLSRDELTTMSDSARVDQRLANFAKASATSRVDSELELIRTEARALLSSYQRQIAYANAQNAWGRLYNSLGLDLTPGEANLDLNKLSELVGTSLNAWHKGVFKRPVAKAKTVIGEIRLVLDDVKPALRADVKDGLIASLAQQGVVVTELETAPWALHVGTQIDGAAENGSKTGLWKMALRRRGGLGVDNAQYQSEVPEALTSESVQALTRLAADAYTEIVVDRLRRSPDSAFARR